MLGCQWEHQRQVGRCFLYSTFGGGGSDVRLWHPVRGKPDAKSTIKAPLGVFGEATIA